MSFTQFQVGQQVPNDVYRIQSVLRHGEYLEFAEDGSYAVRPATSTSSDRQKWRIQGNSVSGGVNTYTITNVASGLHLAYAANNNQAHLYAYQKGETWTIEPRGAEFIIGLLGDERCIDYPATGKTEQHIQLWGRNNQVQQRWVLERVPPPAPYVPPPYHPPAPKPIPHVVGEMDKIIAVNATDQNAAVFVSAYGKRPNGQAPDGSDKWYDVDANAQDKWHRHHNQVVMFTMKGTRGTSNGTTVGAWVSPGMVATLVDWNKPIHIS